MKKENKKLQKATLAALLLLPIFALSFIYSASSETTFQTVRIRANGDVDPPSTPIQRDGNTYFFTGNVFTPIVVEKSNIIIDGAGYTLKGPYNGTKIDDWMVGQGPNTGPTNASLWTIGIDLDPAAKPNNITVSNLNIENFYIGMYIWTRNNVIDGNALTGNVIGVMLTGDSNTISGNYIANNDEGVFFGVNNPGVIPLNITFAYNSFLDNKVQFGGCTCLEYNLSEAIHTWDNGEKGNFWSDYNGTDTNQDGLGDTPYIIDVRNQDRYPIIQNTLTTPTPSNKPIINQSILITIVILILLVTTTILLRKRKTHLKKKRVTGAKPN